MGEVRIEMGRHRGVYYKACNWSGVWEVGPKGVGDPCGLVWVQRRLSYRVMLAGFW